ncbi:ThuA domain-containing protein [Phycicoccus sp. BSK3Z-2]|uniref:ThuA domain-containing protein n=1 Tax=Phycicoccus avicenniae TaxID=2828860 RepID=A0A941D670_9MICO|nr:ThuA domain-containing protein [Phycicoccus avicenniae]MBR7742363.1 ThuA domain-containing protein [Phycicoccus avicenniae]
MTSTQRRVRRPLAALGALSGMVLGLGIAPAVAEEETAGEEYKVLVVGETLGFRHSHIDETTHAVIDLGEEHGFSVDVWDPPNTSGGWWGPGSPGQPELTMDSTPFTSAADLSQYATIVFASPVDNTNDLDPDKPRLLDDAELAAFQGYMRAGGGYVGLHAATDTMHTVPWYSELTGGGARFAGHPRQQTATMRVESPTHPSTEHLPLEWTRFDEWYNYTSNPRDDVHVLMTLDESTYEGGTMGADHPIAWCHNFEGGRSWYEGAGHVDESYSDPLFVEHMLKGIEWTAGVVEGGGNCVTFDEVESLVDGADGRGSKALAPKVEAALAAAESAADAGDRATAVKHLRKARGMAHGLGGGAHVSEKVSDLLEWQEGLAAHGM